MLKVVIGKIVGRFTVANGRALDDEVIEFF